MLSIGSAHLNTHNCHNTLTITSKRSPATGKTWYLQPLLHTKIHYPLKHNSWCDWYTSHMFNTILWCENRIVNALCNHPSQSYYKTWHKTVNLCKSAHNYQLYTFIKFLFHLYVFTLTLIVLKINWCHSKYLQ